MRQRELHSPAPGTRMPLTGLNSLYKERHFFGKPPLPLIWVSVSLVARASGGGMVWEGFPEEVAFRLQSGVKRGDSQTRRDGVGARGHHAGGTRECLRHMGPHLKNRGRKTRLDNGRQAVYSSPSLLNGPLVDTAATVTAPANSQTHLLYLTPWAPSVL